MSWISKHFYKLFIVFILAADYLDEITLPRGFPETKPELPTANQVSQSIFHVELENTGNDLGLAVAFMTFGQFLDHDITEVPIVPCTLTEFGT